MRKIIVKYNSNPNAPKEFNHLGPRFKMTSQDSREFTVLGNALDFMMECTSPITQLRDLHVSEWTKRFDDIKEDKGLARAEEFYWENREQILLEEC